jgi:hypothetical protein
MDTPRPGAMGRSRDPVTPPDVAIHLPPLAGSPFPNPFPGLWTFDRSATVRLRLHTDSTVYTASRHLCICIRAITPTSGSNLELVDSSGDAGWIMNCHMFPRSRRCWIQIRNGRRACETRSTGISAAIKARIPLESFWTGFDEPQCCLCRSSLNCKSAQHASERTKSGTVVN